MFLPLGLTARFFCSIMWTPGRKHVWDGEAALAGKHLETFPLCDFLLKMCKKLCVDELVCGPGDESSVSTTRPIGHFEGKAGDNFRYFERGNKSRY
jgi:hypothetical protein